MWRAREHTGATLYWESKLDRNNLIATKTVLWTSAFNLELRISSY